MRKNKLIIKSIISDDDIGTVQTKIKGSEKDAYMAAISYIVGNSIYMGMPIDEFTNMMRDAYKTCKNLNEGGYEDGECSCK